MANKKKHGLFYKLAGIGTIKSTFEHTQDMLKSATKRDPNQYINESFDEALIRLGIPEDKREQHLVNVYKNLKISFIMMVSAVIIFCIFGIINNLIKGNLIPVFLYLSLSFAFLSVAANNSLRCFQIRKQKLGGLKEWYSSPREWLPSSLPKAWNELSNNQDKV